MFRSCHNVSINSPRSSMNAQDDGSSDKAAAAAKKAVGSGLRAPIL